MLTPLDNRISRQDDSLLAELAQREIGALTCLARLVAANRRPTAPPPTGDPKPAKPAPNAPAATEELLSAQEVTFAEVLHEMQSHLPPTNPADELPSWVKLNIQNAPPVVAKLLGLKAT